MNCTTLKFSEKTSYLLTPRQLELINKVTDNTSQINTDHKICEGVLDGTIPSAIVDSGASSNVGTTKDGFQLTGMKSSKFFRLPDGSIQAATEIAKLPYDVRAPAKDIHITPGISENSLISTSKMADAGYITVFDQDHVKIYDANNTQIIATRSAVINGWRDTSTGMWRVALLPTVSNVNTDTALLNRPPTEFLPNRPLPTEAIHNVYELKTQPELVRYLHAAAGYPTKSTWVKAIKNNQYASWPGLMTDAVRKYFPESEETHKGHGRKKKATQQVLEEGYFTGQRPTSKSGKFMSG